MQSVLLDLDIMEESKMTIFEHALNSMEDVVLIFDKDSRVLFANDAYTKVFNLPKRKILGKKIADFEPNSPGLKVLKTGKPKVNFYNYVISGKKDVVGNINPIWRKGEIVGAICVMRHIDSLFHLNNELQEIDKLPYWKRTMMNDIMDPVFKKLVGVNDQFNKCFHLASHVAKTDASVLLLGKTGVGKDVFARSIHEASPYRDGPFIPINMAAIPETLMESELFGYEEGAFSGANRKGKMGKFELANNGTLFLDEIGEMSLNTQAKILRALQDRVIERVGGIRFHKINVRIIAATNQNLEEMVRQGKFRADLYFRLNIITIHIPTLKERSEDIKILSHHFLQKMNQKYNKSLVFSQDVLDIFESYDWQGNVRELQSIIEQLVILEQNPVIGVNAIPIHILEKNPQEKYEGIQDDSSSKETNLHVLIGNIERNTIEYVLSVAKTRTEAIKMLGISRRAFYQKIKFYNLDDSLCQ